MELTSMDGWKTRKESAFRKLNHRKIFDTAVPLLLTIAACTGIWSSEVFFGTNSTNSLLLNVVSHTILVTLALLGILICGLSLAEAGVISRNIRYSLYWGLYLSASVCIPAIVFVVILHVSGLISLRIGALSAHRLATDTAVSFVLGGFCEELFYRGFVQGSLNRAVGYRISPVASGIIFGVSHLDNYINPFTGMNSFNAGAIIWVLISCFVGVYFGFLRRKCGDVYCPALFHGSQDLTTSVMSMLGCSSNVSIVALSVGWTIFLSVTYRQFINSEV